MKMESRKKGVSSLRQLLLIVSIYATIGYVWGDDPNSTSPKVTIIQGALQGVNLVTNQGRKTYGFLGIPYAQPPIGDLRFANPVAAGCWNGTLNATVDSNMCPQTDFLSGNVEGDEDCLYLNVYTPMLPSSETCNSLPVMVWIYGGSFMSGSGNSAVYGPKYLLDKDVLLVVPNYRVGALGFLSTGDEASPGNYGLKDIVLSLEWIQENIKYFGGDPGQVTVFGQSSGAASAQLLALSDSSKGLFQRYVTQSGSALAYWAYRPSISYTERAVQLGEYLGCSSTDSTILVNCLRALSASQIVDATLKMFVWQGYPEVIWGPTDEPDIKGAFLMDSPANLLASGIASDIPWMTGVTRDDGLSTSAVFHDNPELFNYFLANDTILPYVIEYNDHVDNVTDFTTTLKAYYLNDLNADTNLLLSNTTNLVTDGSMAYPQRNAIHQHIALGGQPPYVYTFAYRGTFSYSYYWSGGDTANFGVAHGDDVIYLFPQSDSIFVTIEKEMSETDLEMVDIMAELLVSFATTGIPNTTGLSDDVIWEPYNVCSKNYLQIGNDSELTLNVGYFFHGDEMQFWETLTK